MAKQGPIILIEDDADDKELFEDILRELGIENKVIWFGDTDKVIDYLQTTTDQPFLIVCDMNLPKEDGLHFKKRLDQNEELRRKSIPFIFYSTSVDKRSVTEAFTETAVQGFFHKNSNFTELKKTVRLMCEYWQECWHPNS